ncbi:hypothetical protein AcidC75_34400 [Acidisoma sp. C75]
MQDRRVSSYAPENTTLARSLGVINLGLGLIDFFGRWQAGCCWQGSLPRLIFCWSGGCTARPGSARAAGGERAGRGCLTGGARPAYRRPSRRNLRPEGPSMSPAPAPVLETVSLACAHGGRQGVYRHASAETGTAMTFAVFEPPQAAARPVPVLWFLSGLTCTHANCMDKGEYRRLAAELGLMIVLPDTSPRGPGVPDEPENWQFGQGAGFYLDAMQEPFARSYRMYSYVTRELPALIGAQFPADLARQGITGHSMGGHGALTIALKNPDTFRSASAFAPIVRPGLADWSRPALGKYLGADEAHWRPYDTCLLIEDGHRFPEMLIDQGAADPFLEGGLMPEELRRTAERHGQPIRLRLHQGYDHSYFFISTFMDDHLRWHAERLRG